MEPQRAYLDRLAQIESAIGAHQVDGDTLLDRAAGLLAGRIGCRFREAHAHLLRIAAEQHRHPASVAADAITVLERLPGVGSGHVHDAVERTLWPLRGRTSAPRSPDAAMPVAPDAEAVIQQVLDAMPGGHAWLVPVRDGSGAVTDYLIRAVSPEARDAAGRRGGQMLGLSIAECYPDQVDGPLWRVYREVLTDGAPQEVGPVHSDATVNGIAAHAVYVVRVYCVNGGLLIGWLRHDEEHRLGERIAQTERLGNLGWGEWDLVTGQLVWSDELYRIYERDRAAGPLPSVEQEAMTLPEDRPISQQAAELFGRGETVDVTYRVRVNDRVKHLRSVIDAVRDAAGRPLKVYGIVQDVTARETARAKLAAVEEELRQHQRSLAAEHELAARLQQIILPIPHAPIDLPGLRAAVRYLPAEQDGHVGGDWFHAGVAHDGSVILAVGDVAGHGVRAATTMAQLRHALAALAATTTTTPTVLLGHLNRLLHRGGTDTGTASAIVARFDPGTRTMVWAQAGHPAPLLCSAGRTAALPRPEGPLLGALGDARYDTAAITLDAGDLLLLYTDGLIEHRRLTIDEGMATVIATIDRITATGADRPLADLLAQLRRANPRDDTCVVAVRPLPQPHGP